MFNFLKLAGSLAMTLLATCATAFNENCQGSARNPDYSSCQIGMRKIRLTDMYTDQSEFSSGSCMIKYRTGGAGPQPVSGQVIWETVRDILDVCYEDHGSFGTGNCDSCHVTVNFRAD